MDEHLMEKVNLRDKFSLFSEYWQPKIVGEINGSEVKLVKVRGEFVWHHHEREDELFLVIAGSMRIQMRDRTVHLGTGEFFIVPKGVEHCPSAEEECHVLLLEPKGTLNTGNVTNGRTVQAQVL